MSTPSERHAHLVQYLDERRRTPRLQLLGELQCEVASRREPMGVRDLSLGGFAIDATERFEAGEVHEVRFLVNETLSVTLAARVVHCGDFSTVGHRWFVVGLEFVDQTHTGRKEAARLIDLVTSVLHS